MSICLQVRRVAYSSTETKAELPKIVFGFE